jgi:hypothetical protein
VAGIIDASSTEPSFSNVSHRWGASSNLVDGWGASSQSEVEDTGQSDVFDSWTVKH